MTIRGFKGSFPRSIALQSAQHPVTDGQGVGEFMKEHLLLTSSFGVHIALRVPQVLSEIQIWSAWTTRPCEPREFLRRQIPYASLGCSKLDFERDFKEY
jgi:hypothetical protein